LLETIRNAFKVKDIRKRLLYMFIMLIVVRIGSQLPIPGVSRDYFKDFFNNQVSALNFFNAMTGGSFTKMSIFALSITPYITSSIIMQLLTIAIPKLEEMQKDGEDGRKKIVEFTRYLNIVLSVIEGAAFAIGFGNQNLLEEGITVKSVTVMIVAMTAGSALLMWFGEQITEKGIGNGISIILMFNIVSGMPEDFGNLYVTFVQGASSTTNGLIAAVIIVGLVVAMVAFIIVLQDAIRKIPVQYAKKLQGRKMVGGQQSLFRLRSTPRALSRSSSQVRFCHCLSLFQALQEYSLHQAREHHSGRRFLRFAARVAGATSRTSGNSSIHLDFSYILF
jgi:preprotein translocase subunit SecY